MSDLHLTDEELEYLQRGHRAALAIVYGAIAGLVVGGIMYMTGLWW